MSRKQKKATPKKDIPEPNETDLKLFELITMFDGALSRETITDHIWGHLPETSKYANKRLRELAQFGYLKQFPYGRKDYFALTRSGAKKQHLNSVEPDREFKFKPFNEERVLLPHDDGNAYAALHLQRWIDSLPDYEVVYHITNKQFKTDYLLKVLDLSVKLVPDHFMMVERTVVTTQEDGTEKEKHIYYPLFLEFDRSKESHAQKVDLKWQKYDSFLRSKEYRSYFGVTTARVLFICQYSKVRARNALRNAIRMNKHSYLWGVHLKDLLEAKNPLFDPIFLRTRSNFSKKKGEPEVEIVSHGLFRKPD